MHNENICMYRARLDGLSISLNGEDMREVEFQIPKSECGKIWNHGN